MPSTAFPADRPPRPYEVAIVGADMLHAALPARPVQLAHGILACGYDLVVPVSWGEERLAHAALGQMSERRGQPVIFGSCPLVRDRLSRAGESASKHLLTFVAPPVATARYLAALQPELRVRVTYFGACPGAQDESIQTQVAPDAFLGYLESRGISLAQQPAVFDSVVPPDRRRHFSLPGGVPAPDAGRAHGLTHRWELLSDPGFIAEVAELLLNAEEALIDIAPCVGCACAGSRGRRTGQESRESVTSLEPPRSGLPTVDLNVAVPLAADWDGVAAQPEAPTVGVEVTGRAGRRPFAVTPPSTRPPTPRPTPTPPRSEPRASEAVLPSSPPFNGQLAAATAPNGPMPEPPSAEPLEAPALDEHPLDELSRALDSAILSHETLLIQESFERTVAEAVLVTRAHVAPADLEPQDAAPLSAPSAPQEPARVDLSTGAGSHRTERTAPSPEPGTGEPRSPRLPRRTPARGMWHVARTAASQRAARHRQADAETRGVPIPVVVEAEPRIPSARAEEAVPTEVVVPLPISAEPPIPLADDALYQEPAPSADEPVSLPASSTEVIEQAVEEVPSLRADDAVSEMPEDAFAAPVDEVVEARPVDDVVEALAVDADTEALERLTPPPHVPPASEAAPSKDSVPLPFADENTDTQPALLADDLPESGVRHVAPAVAPAAAHPVQTGEVESIASIVEQFERARTRAAIPDRTTRRRLWSTLMLVVLFAAIAVALIAIFQ